MKQIFICLIMGMMLNSCNSSKNIVGNTKDKHGCQVTAGYTWSEINKDCIRLFENAKCIGATNYDTSLLNVYVVFSSDSSKAELFMPTSKANPILRLKGKEWEGNGYVLSQTNGKYRLTKDGKEVKLQ